MEDLKAVLRKEKRETVKILSKVLTDAIHETY